MNTSPNPKAQQLKSIGNQTIRCGISQAFHNKNLRSGYTKKAFSNSFKATVTTRDKLVSHITSGGAYSMAIFENNRRKAENFISAQIIGLDCDDNTSVQDGKNHPFAGSQAFLISATKSSGLPDKDGNIVHKSRMLFLLDEPITDPKQFERYLRALQLHCADLRPDPACKDSSRVFFGSDNPDYVVMDNILPVAVLETIAQQYDVVSKPEPVAPRIKTLNKRIQQYNTKALSSISDRDKRRYLSYARIVLDERVNELTHTTEGERNTTLFRCGARMGNFVSAGMIEFEEVKTALYNAGLQSGLDESDIVPTLPNAIDEGMTTPFDLSRLDKPQYRLTSDNDSNTLDSLQPVDLAEPTERVKQRYIKLKGISGLTFIKSPMGTGKTYAFDKWLTQKEAELGRELSVLAITHNRKLIDNTTSRWTGFENYQDIDPDEYSQCKKLIITPNSIHHIADEDGNLPTREVIVIDEPYHNLSALNSNLFEDNEASSAWTIMSILMQNASHIIGMDAYMSQTVVDVFTSASQFDEPATVILNEYQADKGQVTIHDDIGFCLQSAINDAIKHDKLLVVAVETNNQGQSVVDVFSDVFSPESVLFVNGDNSNSQAITDLMRDFNQYAHLYKAVVHTSAISSGVSIEVPAIACGLFDGSTTQGGQAGLVANDYAQMIGRTRIKKACHVWVKDISRNLENDASVMYRQIRRKALASHKLIGKTQNPRTGNVEPCNYQLLDIHSRIQASKNMQANNPVAYTIAYLQHDGYTIAYATGEDKALTDRIYNRTELRKGEMKALVLDLNTPVVSSKDLREMKMKRDGEPITALIRAGNTKYKILGIVGDVPITEQIYADLHSPKQQGAVYRLVNLFTDDEVLKRLDSYESKKVPHLWRYRLLHKRFDLAIIQHLFDTIDLHQVGDMSLSKDELNQRMDGFVTHATQDEYLASVLETMQRKYTTYSGLAIAIFKTLGLKLKGEQGRINGERTRVYQLIKDVLIRQLQYVSSHLTIQGEREQARKRKI